MLASFAILVTRMPSDHAVVRNRRAPPAADASSRRQERTEAAACVV